MKKYYPTALLTVLLALACLYPVPTGAQGERGRMIKRMPLPSDPVDNITPEVGGKAVRFNGPFDAGRDWLKGLKVRLRNRSGKNIVFANALLNIPKMGTMPLPFAVQIRYGEPPVLDAPPDASPVPHGKVFELTLSDNAYDTTMNFLSEHQVTDVVGVEFSNLFIAYDDDTAWEDGTMFRRDLTGPRRWKSSGPAKPVDDEKPMDEIKPPREEFKNISLLKTVKYYASRTADDETFFDYHCASYFSSDFALCGTTLGSLARTAPDETGRPNDPDENPLNGNRKAVVKKIVNCEGLACSGKTGTVHKAQYDYRYGYVGGKEWL